MLKPLMWSNLAEVVCFLDNDSRLAGLTINNIPILNPKEVLEISYDKIIICPIFTEEIQDQLVFLGVDIAKIEVLYKEQYFSTNKRTINGCVVGRFSYLKPSTLIVDAEIGKFCHIGDNCQIGLKGHSVAGVSTYPLNYHFTNETNDPSKDASANLKRLREKVLIKNDVYIGEGVTIMSGVTVGNGAVIGSKSFVNKDVEDYAIVGGVPARLIKLRFHSDEIAKLLAIEWWNWPDEKIRKNASKIASGVDVFLSSSH
ncbi:MAG: CatB-related O-acetyltransferase [Cyclobacteriaceae bacterium]